MPRLPPSSQAGSRPIHNPTAPRIPAHKHVCMYPGEKRQWQRRTRARDRKDYEKNRAHASAQSVTFPGARTRVRDTAPAVAPRLRRARGSDARSKVKRLGTPALSSAAARMPLQRAISRVQLFSLVRAHVQRAVTCKLRAAIGIACIIVYIVAAVPFSGPVSRAWARDSLVIVIGCDSCASHGLRAGK